jgi:ribosomal protein S18 acetylase RimI-like enzyme
MASQTDAISYREAAPHDLGGMAAAFCLAEPTSVWARAGIRFASIYLRHYLYRADELAVVADRGGQIVGASLGTTTGSSSLAHFYRGEVGALFVALARQPRSLALFLSRAVRGLDPRRRPADVQVAERPLPPHCAYMALFYVVPDARGQQIGSMMLDRFCALMAGRGADWCWAQTAADNVASRIAQERAGFESVAQRNGGIVLLRHIGAMRS